MARKPFPRLWLQEELITRGDEYFARLIDDLNQAQKSITVEMYIFEKDQLGMRVFKTLNEAAQRGVKISMLLDAVGSHNFIQYVQKHSYHPKIRIKVYNPHPWTYGYGNMFNWVKILLVFMKRLIGVNKRNHRKVITIDRKITWLGSFNISMNHCEEFLGSEAWDDIGVRLKGWITPLMILGMKRSWSFKEYIRYRKKIPNKKVVRFTHPDLRMNQSHRLRRRLYRDFLQRVKNARKRVWIRTGYFTPKRRIVRKLAQAAKRGVDVRILLSAKSDVFYYSILQTAYYDYLVKHGVKIYIYQERLMHAKNYFFDRFVSVGSTNLNYRSFLHDLEVDIRLRNKNNMNQLAADFHHRINHSIQVDKTYLANRPLLIKIASRLLILVRYWN